MDFAGCYLSDDKDNLRKYYIPKGDINTRIKPRQLALFFACGNDGKGTFHTNFTIVPGRTLYLVSNDGRTIIDSIEVPSDLKPGKSVSRISTDNKGMEFRTVVSDPTPLAQNGDVNAATKSQIMEERDPHGWIMTVTAICVVFLALFILFIIYKYVGKAFTGDFKKKKTSKPQGNNMNEETALAIAMALDKPAEVRQMQPSRQPCTCTSTIRYTTRRVSSSQSGRLRARGRQSTSHSGSCLQEKDKPSHRNNKIRYNERV